MSKASKSRYREEVRKAREAAYRYRNNPFEEGTRIWRLCENARRTKATYDWIFEDMEEVYGPIGTKRKIVHNAPGSFEGPLV